MKKIKVLAFALYGTKAASTRIRINQYKDRLAKEGILLETNYLLNNSYLDSKFNNTKIAVLPIFLSYIKRIKILLFKKDYDLLIIHCELFPFFPAIIERFFLRNKKYIYDFDDAFYLKYQKGKYSFLKYFLANKFSSMIGSANEIFAGNSVLADYAKQYNNNVKFIPSVVDTDILKPINKNNFCGNRPLVIGWIGSPSTEKYLDLLIAPLENIGESYPIMLKVVGGKCPSISNIKTQNVPWTEASENSVINSFDIGVMPLDTSEFARGKCGFKLIQYMSCGIPVIASAVGANLEIVSKECGLIVDSSDEWERAFMYFIENPDQIIKLGEVGRQRAVLKFSIMTNLSIITKSIKQVYEG